MTIRGDHFMQGAAMNQRRGESLINVLQGIMQQNREQERYNQELELRKQAQLDAERKAAMNPDAVMAEVALKGYENVSPEKRAIFDVNTMKSGVDSRGNVFMPYDMLRSKVGAGGSAPSRYATAPIAGPMNIPELDMTTYSDGTPIRTNAEGIPVLDGSQLNMNAPSVGPEAAIANIPTNFAGVTSPYAREDIAKARAEALIQAEVNRALRVAEKQEEKIAAEPKAFQVFKNTQFEIRDSVNKAREVRDMISGKSAGLVGQASGWLGGTQARDLQAALKKLKGTATLDTLKKAKAEGVSFGATSENELELIGSTVAALDQAQSPDSLRAAIDEYIAKMERMPQIIAEDYKIKYGFYPEGYTPPQKVETPLKRRRYNPQTGAFE